MPAFGQQLALDALHTGLLATPYVGPLSANGGRATGLMDIKLETTLDMHLG